MTMAPKNVPFGTLARSDLTTFDKEAKALILAAIEAGCIGRVSNRGHCILRNDAGQTTAVPRNMTTPNRSAQNAKAQVRRLLTDHREQNGSDASRRDS